MDQTVILYLPVAGNISQCSLRVPVGVPPLCMRQKVASTMPPSEKESSTITSTLSKEVPIHVLLKSSLRSIFTSLNLLSCGNIEQALRAISF